MSKTVPHPLFLHTSRLTKRPLHMTGVLDSFPDSHVIWYMSANNYIAANSPHWLHTIWSLSVILVLLGSQRRRGVGVGAVSETLAGWHFDFIRSRAEARSHLMPGAVSNGRPPDRELWMTRLMKNIAGVAEAALSQVDISTAGDLVIITVFWVSLTIFRVTHSTFRSLKPYSHIYHMCFGFKAVQAV